VRVVARKTLSEALELGPRELIALVGGGGKSSAVRLIAGERARAGDRLIVTTTTAMFETELATVGPLVFGSDVPGLSALEASLVEGRAVAAAASRSTEGKVAGLDPATVDGLWARGLADCIIVEADGSRGRPVKAFAVHEPPLPSSTTTTVLVAGLDAVGRPMTEEYVHRAEEFADMLSLDYGSELTAPVVADALREMIARLRRLGAPRVVVLLNKLDVPDGETAARGVAEALFRETATADPGIGEEWHPAPDGIAAASLAERRFCAVDVSVG